DHAGDVVNSPLDEIGPRDRRLALLVVLLLHSFRPPRVGRDRIAKLGRTTSQPNDERRDYRHSLHCAPPFRDVPYSRPHRCQNHQGTFHRCPFPCRCPRIARALASAATARSGCRSARRMLTWTSSVSAVAGWVGGRRRSWIASACSLWRSASAC